MRAPDRTAGGRDHRTRGRRVRGALAVALVVPLLAGAPPAPAAPGPVDRRPPTSEPGAPATGRGAGPGVASRPPAHPPAVAPLAEELEAAVRTRRLLEHKLSVREERVRGGVRELYKLTRAGHHPLWVEPSARGDRARLQGVARRVILRDLDERRVLRDELAAASAAERRLRVALARALVSDTGLPTEPLVRPVPGPIRKDFGEFRDRATGARLPRRGVALATAADTPVRAPLGGRVRWAGPLRRLGLVVVLDHGQGLVSVLSGLRGLDVRPGQPIDAGAVVGAAGAGEITLELRRHGHPVDPAPLLGARR